MENKKKCHGYLKLFLLLLFGMLFATSSTCFANVTADYIKYGFEHLAEYGNWGSTYTQTAKDCLALYDDLDFQDIANNLNTQLASKNIATLDNRNLIMLTNCGVNGSTFWFDIYLVFSNCSVPNGVNNLGYLYFFRNSSKHGFGAYSNLGGYIYYNAISLNLQGTYRFLHTYLNSTTSNNVSAYALWQSGNSFNNDLSVYYTRNAICCAPASVYVNYPLTVDGTKTNYPMLLRNYSAYIDDDVGYYVPSSTPVDPDTGNTGEITDPNGDVTGNIDLSGIETGLDNINTSINTQGQAVIDNQNENTDQIVSSIDNLNNTLTSNADDTIDNTIITSGDIVNTVDFSIINNNQNYSAYTNFWYNLTSGFSSSMTNVVRTLPVEFRGQNYIINLDEFTVFIPNVLKIFLGIVSSVFVCLYITRESKHIAEDLQTASIDNVANKLTEDFETNMF